MMLCLIWPRLYADVSYRKITIQLLLCKWHNIKFETGGLAGEAKSGPARKDKLN